MLRHHYSKILSEMFIILVSLCCFVVNVPLSFARLDNGQNLYGWNNADSVSRQSANLEDNHYGQSPLLSMPSRKITKTTTSKTAYHGNDNPVFSPSNPPSCYNAVILVAFANIIWNTLRPDEIISWPMRLPRLLWEMTIVVVAKIASHESASILPSMVHLLLSILLGSTALVDLFFWAPVFGFLTSFETCHGGLFQPRQCQSDYFKGLGRLIVIFQCFVTGLVYLNTSIVAIGRFLKIREEQKIRTIRNVETERWIQGYS
jgi:hypothetical protein